ncbi:MAG TPA: amidohydrolase family protein, partial [Thermoanaerobaculia bacterium]
IRERVNKPETVDVLYANAGLTATGGHPSQLYGPARADQSYFVVDSVADFERKWPQVLAGRPDFIKVYLEYSEDPKRNRGLKTELLRPIVERAHAAKLTVSAHVASSADVHAAIAAGIDEITHLPLQPIDPADAALAAKKKVAFVTTVLSHRETDGDPMPTHRANLALLKRAGVRVLLGVDNQPLVVDEAEAVRKLGVYDARELLTMLVTTTPHAIFPKRRFARLEDGYEASFLALDANPLEDFSAIRRIALRVKQGHVLEIAPLKRSVAEALMPAVMQGGAAAAIAEYKRLKAAEPDAWDYGEARVNQLGYALLQHDKVADAIAIFRFNAELFPQSANTWDSLGEAYLRANDRAQAIANYRKSLELNPHNKNAEEALKKLEQP